MRSIRMKKRRTLKLKAIIKLHDNDFQFKLNEELVFLGKVGNELDESILKFKLHSQN